jgi:hypothetical protein
MLRRKLPTVRYFLLPEVRTVRGVRPPLTQQEGILRMAKGRVGPVAHSGGAVLIADLRITSTYNCPIIDEIANAPTHQLLLVPKNDIRNDISYL